MALAASAGFCALVLAACSTTPATIGQSGPSAGGITDPSVGSGNQTASPAGSPYGSAGTGRSRVRIALLLPLEGVSKTSIIAKSLKQAAEMAVFDSNNPAIELIVKDDKGTADGAKAAAAAALQDGAEVILGPLFAGSVSSVKSVTANSRVPVIAFSNDRTVAGQNTYLMSFLPEPEVHRVVSFAASKGRKRFAALIPQTAYGRTTGKAFQEAVRNAGGLVIATETFPPNSNATIEPVQRLLETVRQTGDLGAPVDALFVPGGPEILQSITPIVRYTELDTSAIRLLGTGAWDFPNIGRDKTLVGGWYASPDPRGWQNFSQRFARMFGQAPPRLATLAYDAVNVAVELSAAPHGQRFTQARLTRPEGFRGVEGPVRFTPEGLPDRDLAVLEVKTFGSAMIDGPRRVEGTRFGTTQTPKVETGSTPQEKKTSNSWFSSMPSLPSLPSLPGLPFVGN